jgi:hypothetical protein
MGHFSLEKQTYEVPNTRSPGQTGGLIYIYLSRLLMLHKQRITHIKTK